jgi:hypothetical protein
VATSVSPMAQTRVPVTLIFETESAASFWARRDCIEGMSTAQVPTRHASVVLPEACGGVGLLEGSTGVGQFWRRRLLLFMPVLVRNKSVLDVLVEDGGYKERVFVRTCEALRS